MAQSGDENTPPKRRREEVLPLKPSVRKRVEEWELGDEPLQLIRCAFCGRPGNRYSQGHSRRVKFVLCGPVPGRAASAKYFPGAVKSLDNIFSGRRAKELTRCEASPTPHWACVGKFSSDDYGGSKAARTRIGQHSAR